MEKQLTVIEISNIAMGYNWNPDMSYEEFVEKNNNIGPGNGQEIWDLIEERYIDFKFN